VIEPVGPDSYDPARDPYETQFEPAPPRRVDARTDLPGQGGPAGSKVSGSIGTPRSSTDPFGMGAIGTGSVGMGPVGTGPMSVGPTSIGPTSIGPVGTESMGAGWTGGDATTGGAHLSAGPGAETGAGRGPADAPSRSRAQASAHAQTLQIGPRHDTREGGLLRRRSGSPVPPVPVSRGRAAFSAVTEIVVVLVMALVLSFVIKTFLVQAFFIPSESMYTTLLKGDRVLVSKLTPGPFALHRGDVVVFKDPGGWLDPQAAPVDSPIGGVLRQTLTFIGLLPTDSGEHLIKRVIGLPGDTVACCDPSGRVTVDGVSIDETPYLNAGDQPSVLPFHVTVPANNLWVMGDHRSVSEDSRRHQALRGGFVPISDVVGRAFVIVWPFERVGGISVPGSVFARVPDPPPAK